ncbi:MAG: AAA family ATPase [Pseudomonadota bacterium]
MPSQNIPRNIYLNEIKLLLGKDIVKVFRGIRGAGKSFLLNQMLDVINTRLDNATILHINKDSDTFKHIKSDSRLIKYIQQKCKRSLGLVYLFIDEIQEISNCKQALEYLLSEGRYDIYCAGDNISDSLFGSDELFKQFLILPLSYSENLEFHELPNTMESFQLYLKYGGMPYMKNLTLKHDIVDRWLKRSMSNIFLKDVIEREKLRNIEFLERLIQYLGINMGTLLTADKIQRALRSTSYKISEGLVHKYIGYLEEADFIMGVKRVNVKTRKIMSGRGKYYFTDIGMRNSSIGYSYLETKQSLENLVYLELIRRKYEVKVGQLKEGKLLDFVCERGDERLYVQVEMDIDYDPAYERGKAAIAEAPNDGEKLLLALKGVGNERRVDDVGVRNIMSFLRDG